MHMNEADIQRIGAWLTERGLQGAGESELLNGFCDACRAAGLELDRVIVLIDTLHPVHEGRAFRWRSVGMGDEEAITEYGRSQSGEGSAWQRTPFFHLLTSGGDELRRRIGFGDALDFSILQEMAELGQTDYIALVHRFAGEGSIGEMDCFYSQWTTAHPNGFSDPQIDALRRLVPTLALAVKCVSLGRIAGTLVETYLGRDAGARVLEGKIMRGAGGDHAAAQRLCGCRDLRGL